MNSKKILITGATGKVAEAFIRKIKAYADPSLVLLSRTPEDFIDISNTKFYKSDLRDLALLKKICYAENPDIIINFAAFNNLEQSEKDKKLCWEVNTSSVENLVSICRIKDYHLIQMSCDMVFKGDRGPYDEEALPEPISYFGKCRHAAENAIRVGLLNYTIIRTGSIYGYSSFGNTDFVKETIKQFETGKEFCIVKGESTTPVLSDDVANGLIKIIENPETGIYHFASDSALTKFEMAEIIADVFGFDKSKLHPILPNAYSQKVHVPMKGGLISKTTQKKLGLSFLSFDLGLKYYKEQLNETFNFKK